MVRLSVVIPFHNRKVFLRESVLSVCEAIDPLQDEIILVDDGSSDGSALHVADLPVLILSHPSQLGVSAARNTGVRAARGEYLTFLDSDDLLCRDSIRLRLEYLEAHPEEAAVGGAVAEVIDHDGSPLEGKVELGNFLLPPFRLDIGLLTSGRQVNTQLWLIVFRTSSLTRCGVFDEGLGCGEDLEFLCRYVRGQTIPFLPLEVARYRLHDSNLSMRREEGRIVPTRIALAAWVLLIGQGGAGGRS